MKKIWKQTMGYEGLYLISSHGDVKTISRKDSLGRVVKEKMRKLVSDTRGYLQVGLYKNKKMKLELVHRLVAKTFIENIIKKPCVNHKNGIKTDNRVENIEWCTYGENNIHACENGLMAGEKNPTAKLTVEQVRTIREKFNNNRHKLAKEYKVDESTIRSIISKKTWRYI